MTSHGIAGKVAVVAMGCTRFGERWDSSVDDLLLEATTECLESLPGVTKDDVDAYWLGTLGSGQSGLTLSRALCTEDKPVTRLENYCATGSEAFRNACYAVAAGAYDVVMAVGVEKLKDSGFSGLLRADPPGDGTAAELSLTAPAAFSLLDPAYCAKHGVHPDEMREAMTHVAGRTIRTAREIPRLSSDLRFRRRRSRPRRR
jgi:acetyl-CoA C-acetyltransferase